MSQEPVVNHFADDEILSLKQGIGLTVQINEGLMISGGGQAIAVEYRWLDGYDLRVGGRSKLVVNQ